MRFQITIKPNAEATSHDEIAIFIVNAPNWATAKTMCDNRVERMILRPEDVHTEIIYASKEECMIRSGSFNRVETVHNPCKGLQITMPSSLETLSQTRQAVVTHEEVPNEMVETPLSFENRRALTTTASYISRIQRQPGGHTLTKEEVDISLFYSALHGVPVFFYRDGNVQCDGVINGSGSGATWQQAYENFQGH